MVPFPPAVWEKVVGEKLVLLFSPDDSAALYPHPEPLLFNTSQVDAEDPDLQRFPNFAGAKCVACVLRPGQMLYIPPTWWHFVRSLSPSFSVSFWWT